MGDVERKLDTDYVHFTEVELLLNYGVGYPDRKLFQNVQCWWHLYKKEVCPVKSEFYGQLKAH